MGVEPHVLRYWEREFRSIRPTKSAKGQRVYSRRDVENLRRVRQLLYGEGFTIAGAKRRMQRADAEASEPGEANEPEDQEALAEPPSAKPIPASAVSKTHQQLLAMRGDIEAFLAELRASGEGPSSTPSGGDEDLK